MPLCYCNHGHHDGYDVRCVFFPVFFSCVFGWCVSGDGVHCTCLCCLLLLMTCAYHVDHVAGRGTVLAAVSTLCIYLVVVMGLGCLLSGYTMTESCTMWFLSNRIG